MIKPICEDIFFLSQKAEAAVAKDKQVAVDLLDTLAFKREECVGMAANMIGVKKAIIVVNMGFASMAMMNPVIVSKSGPYDTEEGCLSLVGTRPCKRYEEIEVTWQDVMMREHKQKFTGWVAEIIQHEIDHLQGIII